MAITLEKRVLGIGHELRALDPKEGDSGGFSGYANLTGIVDEYSSMFMRGCYTNLDSLVRDGFVPVGHDWEELGVAFITLAEEREKGLYIEVRFHSDADAQRVRTRVQERIANNKSVSLSIGFFTLEDETTEIDGKPVRMIKKIDVREVSIVNVPGTPGSQIEDVRGVTAKQQYTEVLGAVGVLLDRFDQIADTRGNVSENRKAEALELADRLDELSARARAFASQKDDDGAGDTVPDDVLLELEKAFGRA